MNRSGLFPNLQGFKKPISILFCLIVPGLLLGVGPSPTPSSSPSPQTNQVEQASLIQHYTLAEKVLSKLNSTDKNLSSCPEVAPPESGLLDIIELKDLRGPEHYKEYSDLVDRVNAQIRLAKEKASKDSPALVEAFRKKDLDTVKLLSKAEMEHYPIVSWKELNFGSTPSLEKKQNCK